MTVSRRTFLGLSAGLLVPLAPGCSAEGRAHAGDGGSADGGGARLPDGALADGGTGPFGSGPEPPSPWTASGSQDDAAFAWGVQAGDADPTSIVLSVRTTEPKVGLRVVRGIADGWTTAVDKKDIVPESGVAQVELGDLAPDTTYSFAFFSADGARRSRAGRFRTALPAGATRTIRFGATSCLGPANAPFANLSQVANAGPLDFFCLLGDTIYADGEDDIENVWRTALSQKGLSDITAATSVIGIWDDHEVDNNWSWSTSGIQARHDAALAAFNRAIPHRSGPAGAKLFRKLSWGDALDVFVLDCRDERHNDDYISSIQMDWLKAGLVASKARFKIILNSVPIMDFSQTPIGSFQASDRWQGYAQRAEILEHIETKNITGVLWVTGDFHFGLITHVGPPGALGENQWEVFCGPSGSAINVAVQGLSTGPQITDIVKTWNAVLFEADPGTGTIDVRFVGDSGQTLAQRALTI